MGHSLLLDTCIVILHRKILMTRGLFLLVHPSRRRVTRWQKNHNDNNCERDYGGTPLIRPPTGHGNLSVLKGVKAYHSLVSHFQAIFFIVWPSEMLGRFKFSARHTRKSRMMSPYSAWNFFQKLLPLYVCMYLFFRTSDNDSLFSFFFCVHVRFFWRRCLGTGIGELHKQSVKKKQIILSKYGINLLRLCSNNYHPHLISCGFFIEFDFPAFSKNTLLDYHNHKRPKPWADGCQQF